MTWHTTGDLAPEANNMHLPDPAEFLRRYPGAEELIHLLDVVADAVEAWRDAEMHGEAGPDRAHMLAIEAALDAMTRKTDG